MLIRAVELDGSERPEAADVRTRGEAITEIGQSLAPLPGETVIDAAGGALLPGLHDHHIHLLALAAAQASVRCGPPDVENAAELHRALRDAATGSVRDDGWLRGVGYHESVAGELDRDALDRLVVGVPTRIQHRSGALWMLNSAALARIGLADRVPDDAPPGVARNREGRSTGRLLRVDSWLRERTSSQGPPTLAKVGRTLSRFGVTGVTDATPGNSGDELEILTAAVRSGELLQRVLLMGRDRLTATHGADVRRGPHKVMLVESDLPCFDELVGWIDAAHRDERAVAIHCVTRVELALAVGTFAAAGVRAGDRIEHASIAPPDLTKRLAELGVCVVTQPNFVRERGDVYLTDVDPADRPWLYRCRALLDAGVAVGAGTDAPFGDPDPWLAMRAAVDRRTASGTVLGAGEALTPERSLALFTSPAEQPGAAPRTVAVGARADLCLLDRPWRLARKDLTSEAVAATIAGGVLTWQRPC